MRRYFIFPAPRPKTAQRGGTHVRFLRRAYFQHLFAEANPLDHLKLLLVRLLWPFIGIAMMLFCTVRAGSGVKARAGKGYIHQLVEQLRLVFFTMVPPVDYYVFELFLPRNYARAEEYLLRQETKNGLYNLLKDVTLPNSARSIFKDKMQFAGICHAQGLAAVPVFAAFGRDGITGPDSWTGHFPRQDLFVKPQAGKGGRGAERFLFKDGNWQGDGQSVYSEIALIRHIAARGQNSPVIVQPSLCVHSGLSDLSNGVLTTFRIVTILDEAFRARAAGAAFRMPVGTNSVVDNFHAGGIAAALDLNSQTLGQATDLGRLASSRWHKAHPLTGAPIEGRSVPFAAEALSLACDAHDLIGDRIIVGWDIAILEDGPCIVEANGFPDLDILQRTRDIALGSSDFGRLFAYHVGEALSRRANGQLYQARGHRFAFNNT